MSIVTKIINIPKKVFNHGIKPLGQSIFEVVKKVNNPFPNTKFNQNIVPFSSATAGATSAVKGAGGFVSKTFNSAKNAISRATMNPFAGVSIKQGLKNIGGKIIGGGITGVKFGLGYGIAKSLSTGENINAKSIAKAGAYGLSAGVSPLGTLLGETAGTVTNIQSRWDNPNSWDAGNVFPNPNLPDFNYPKDFTFKIDAPSLSGMPQMPQFFNIPAPSYQGSSYSFSPSVGGGGSEILPLLLAALAAGGLGGYAIGRKRKKKKYKKKR